MKWLSLLVPLDPRVGDDGRVRHRIVLRRQQVGERVCGRFDQQDLAVGAHSVGDLDVQRNFQRPACVLAWITGPARLIDLLKAMIG